MFVRTLDFRFLCNRYWKFRVHTISAYLDNMRANRVKPKLELLFTQNVRARLARLKALLMHINLCKSIFSSKSIHHAHSFRLYHMLPLDGAGLGIYTLCCSIWMIIT